MQGKNFYLFLVVLGGRAKKANVELHDVRWVIGSKIELPHIDGKSLTVKIDAGSEPGDTIEIKGRGLPIQGSSRRGSVMVVLKLDMPRKLTREQKKKISSMADLLGSDTEGIEDRIRREASRRRG